MPDQDLPLLNIYEIEHDGRVGLGLTEKLDAPAVVGGVDDIPGLREDVHELLPQRRFVFGHEHTHAASIRARNLNDG